MNAINFEAMKVALKQNKDGYILTLCVHPDDIPNELMRDFVGAQYMVAMVRLNQDNLPMDREKEFEGDKAMRLSGIVCKEPQFWEFLNDSNEIFECNEKEATTWLRGYLGIKSRSELKTNVEARKKFEMLNKEYMTWKQKS